VGLVEKAAAGWAELLAYGITTRYATAPEQLYRKHESVNV